MNQDGDAQGIFARRFSAAGVATTGEIPVNTTTAGGQVKPSAAMDADGDFAVAWTGPGDGGTPSAFVRRFTADGTAQGDEMSVATAAELAPDVGLGMSAAGAFVVTWGAYANNQGVFSGDVSARLYTPAGAPAGSAFVVNQTLTGAQTDPSAAMDAQGNFVIAWANYAETGGELDLYASHFNATGARDGNEFLVNTSTAGVQNLPAVALHDGGAIVAWHSNHPGSNAFDVYAQRFRRDDPPAVTGVFLKSSEWSPAFRSFLHARGLGESAFGFSIPAGSQLGIIPWVGINQVSIRFSEDVAVAQDDLSVRGVSNADYAVTAFAYDASTRTATWMLARTLRNDKVLIRLESDAGGVSGGVAPLDGEWTGNAGIPDAFPSGDGIPGGDFSFRINILPGDVNGDRAVSAIDLIDLRRRLVAAGPIDLGLDLNGDGVVNAIDMAALRRWLLSRLPEAEPVNVFAATAPIRRHPPIARSLL
jgi:hypothetical protein